MSELLKNLNAAQKKAVTHVNGPFLVVAGAGTGKTTVLINRLAYLVLEKKINSEDILLLTFTEKAAGELEERADKILPYGYTDLWINTFHGFCERILRDHALEIGLSPNFKLLTETEQWVLIKKNLSLFKLDYYKPLGNPTKFISEMLKHFSRLKDEDISSQEYLKYVKSLEKKQNSKTKKKKLSGKDKEMTEAKGKKQVVKNLNVDAREEELEIMRLKELALAYQIYNDLLLENNYLDFGDLIVYTLKLFKERNNVLKHYQKKFKQIMVDEFQDTNLAQYELVKLLAEPKHNLLVTGDDDQSVYKFRGASISNIMQFKEDYKQAKGVVLTENYRSRQEILDCAYHFVQHNNPNRLEVKLNIDKRLLAKNSLYKKKESGVVKHYSFPVADEEVSFVANSINDIYQKKMSAGEEVSWLDFVILVRANDTADAYVKELNRLSIPNQFMSWRGLYYKPLILDILAYFRLLDNYHESSALFRVLSMEPFKVSHIDMIAINKMARRKVWSLFEALKNIEQIREVSAKSQKNIKKLLALIEEHSQLALETRPTKIFLHFVYDSGLLKSLDSDRDLEQFSFLNQFYQKIKRLEEGSADLKLKEFLEAINLELEAGETGQLKLDFADNDTVKIMTIHGAKGLEFKYVYIVNLVDKKFPTIARSEKISIPEKLIKEKLIVNKEAHLEEERRLFYVALTRAKEKLFLTSAKDYGGAREKKPSIFISETGIELDSLDVEKGLLRNEFVKDLDDAFNSQNEKKDRVVEAINYPLPAQFSFSQLAAFSTCPLQYKYSFILKIPAPTDKVSLIFGRVLHNTLYKYLLPFLSEEKNKQASLFPKEKIDYKKLMTKERLLDLYKEYFQEDGYNDKKEREDYRLKGVKALGLFFDEFMANTPSEVMYLEKRFSFKVGTDVIKGVIDRVDRLESGMLEVVDYKTGNTKEKLDFSQKRQLILYQLFLEEYLQEKVSKLTYYYLESGSKLSFVATEKEKEKLRVQMQTEINSIKERDFTPTPSPLCKFCDFNDICEFRQK